MKDAGKATYAYCLVAAKRRPSLAGVPRGLPGLRAPRLLSAGPSLWLVVADAPLARYGSKVIERRLQNLSWVSRCAVAHEAVVEHFLKTDACIPMKLFTMFATDERALASAHHSRRAVRQVVRRVKGRAEWGVRVICDRQRLTPGDRLHRGPGRRISGADYLARKRKLRQSARQFRVIARGKAEEVFDMLARQAHKAERLPTAELQAGKSTLLLDAVYLVPRNRASAFCTSVKQTARRMLPGGYRIVLSGPWPPYNFV